MRFEELIADFETWLVQNRGRANSTAGKYVQYLQRLQAWCESPPEDPRLQPGTRDPLQLTVEDLRTFTGLYAHSLGLAPRGRRPIVSCLRTFYRWAHTNRGLVDVGAKVEQPSAGRRLPRAIKLGNAERLLMAADVSTFLGLRDAAMVATLIGIGPRVSGLVGMNESSLIWHPDEHGDERLTVRLREKGAKERLVPAPVEMAQLLRAYLAHPELALIDRRLANGDQVLFVSVRNRKVPPHEYHGELRRIATRSVSDILDRLGERAGVPRDQRNPHAFRHLFGTELAEEDVPTLYQQALMGHADPKSTEIYTRLAERRLRAVVDRANPLGKMRGPLVDTLRATADASRRHRRSPSGPGRHLEPT